MLQSQCHKVPQHPVDVNYLSLTVILGVQEGVELKLPLTMENRDGRRDGKKKRGGSSSDHSCSLCFTPSHPSSSACLPVTTARGKAVSAADAVLIIIRNQQQAGPVVRLQDNARAWRMPRMSMRLGSSRRGRAAAGASAGLTPRERRSWGQAGSRGRLAEGSFPIAGSGGGCTHAHTQAHSLSHANAQPPGAAPLGSLIREGGNQTS